MKNGRDCITGTVYECVGGDGGVRRRLVGVDGNLEVGVVVGCWGWDRIWTALRFKFNGFCNQTFASIFISSHITFSLSNFWFRNKDAKFAHGCRTRQRTYTINSQLLLYLLPNNSPINKLCLRHHLVYHWCFVLLDYVLYSKFKSHDSDGGLFMIKSWTFPIASVIEDVLGLFFTCKQKQLLPAETLCSL